MAIRHPVAYVGTLDGKEVLLLRPTHDLNLNQPKIKSATWKELASPLLKNYLTEMGKLKESTSPNSFKSYLSSLGFQK